MIPRSGSLWPRGQIHATYSTVDVSREGDGEKGWASSWVDLEFGDGWNDETHPNMLFFISLPRSPNYCALVVSEKKFWRESEREKARKCHAIGWLLLQWGSSISSTCLSACSYNLVLTVIWYRTRISILKFNLLWHSLTHSSQANPFRRLFSARWSLESGLNCRHSCLPSHITTWSNTLDFYTHIYDHGDSSAGNLVPPLSSFFPIDKSTRVEKQLECGSW